MSRGLVATARLLAVLSAIAGAGHVAARKAAAESPSQTNPYAGIGVAPAPSAAAPIAVASPTGAPAAPYASNAYPAAYPPAASAVYPAAYPAVQPAAYPAAAPISRDSYRNAPADPLADFAMPPSGASQGGYQNAYPGALAAPAALQDNGLQNNVLQENGPLPPGSVVYPDTAGNLQGFVDQDEFFYGPQLFPQGLIYRAYLAGEKESRFRSVFNNDDRLGWKWDVTLGGHVGLYRYGNAGNARPEGFQIDIEGAGLVRLDPEEDRDVDSADFRFGVPLTWGDEKHQTKLAYYHLSSHLGDEFLLKTPGYNRLNYSRDVIVFGQSYYVTEELRFYGEVGYALYSDVSRQWEFQFGTEYSPAGCTGFRGAPFAAFNAHLHEELNYGGAFVAQAGWAWRRSPSSGMFRLGVQYFNGASDQFAFYRDYENKWGFGIWYDY